VAAGHIVLYGQQVRVPCLQWSSSCHFFNNTPSEYSIK